MKLLIEEVETFKPKNDKNDKKEKDIKKSNSNFDQKPFVPLAMKWLKDKFGDEFEFKHNPKLSEIGRSYHVSVDGKEFVISGKAFDTTGNEKVDTVVFKIDPIEEPDEEENPFE